MPTTIFRHLPPSGESWYSRPKDLGIAPIRAFLLATAEQLNNFEYVNEDGSGDPRGLRCPVGAHIRRMNPRGQPVTGQGRPGGSNNTHRLIRRGMPYGPVYDPKQPYDGIERGLMTCDH